MPTAQARRPSLQLDAGDPGRRPGDPQPPFSRARTRLPQAKIADTYSGLSTMVLFERVVGLLSLQTYE